MQGDPLGPLLFCLTLYHLDQELSSDLSILHLDDVTIGLNLDCILSDLELVKGAGESLGHILNNSKSEIISANDSTLSLLSGAQFLPLSQASLLGSHLGDEICMSAAIMHKSKPSREWVITSAILQLTMLFFSFELPSQFQSYSCGRLLVFFSLSYGV